MTYTFEIVDYNGHTRCLSTRSYNSQNEAELEAKLHCERCKKYGLDYTYRIHYEFFDV